MTAGAIAVPTIMPLRAPIPGQHKTCIDTDTKIELRSETPGVTIYYTLNGSRPEPFQAHGPAAKSTMRYREPFRLPSGKRTIKAIAVADDGMRESHIVTKKFDIQQSERSEGEPMDNGLNFISDIPAQEEARKEVNKFAHNMVTSKEAWAEVQKMRETEEMMKEMSMVGSNKRKVPTGTRFMNNRMGGTSDRVTIGGPSDVANMNHVNAMGDHESAFKPRRAPPDTATQAMRLQRETDFLKCVYCFAPRPSDPYARFCSECGNPVPPLPQGRIAPPEAGQMGTCVHCKSLVPFNTPNCLICEAPIPAQNQPQASLRLSDKLVCVMCGTANPANMSSCVTCEARLMPTAKPIHHGISAPAMSKPDGHLLTCTKCGRVNNADARFCDWCGAKPAAAVSNLVCSKCQANNNPYAHFCGSCGVQLEPPQRPDVRSSGLAVNINPQTMCKHNQAQWLPITLPANPIPKCDMATQTVGLFFPSQKEITRKHIEEEDKIAMEKQIRDRKPLMTAVSPGRGYWRKQMEHICTHLKAHAQNNAEFRALIGEPRMGKILSTTVHEDGYELSLTVNFALRGTNDPFAGEKFNTEYLSSYARKSGMLKYPSQDSLASGASSARSTGRRTKKKMKKVVKRPTKTELDDRLSNEDKDLLKELGKKGEGRPGTVQQLLEEGADANCVNKDGKPALHLAVENKHVDAIPVLIQEEADINAKESSRGNTALHECVLLGSSGLEILDILLEHGANTQKKNNKGETPYQLAVNSGYEAVSNRLSASVGQSALDKLLKPRGSPTNDMGF